MVFLAEERLEYDAIILSDHDQRDLDIAARSVVHHDEAGYVLVFVIHYNRHLSSCILSHACFHHERAFASVHQHEVDLALVVRQSLELFTALLVPEVVYELAGHRSPICHLAEVSHLEMDGVAIELSNQVLRRNHL